MKQTSQIIAASLLLAVPFQSLGQVDSGATFTRVLTGSVVTDVSHSFGCTWGDYDNDGYLDLVVGGGLGDANALYHNNGEGTFTRITTNAIATTLGDTDGIVWGDYDNDGDLDLFVANWGMPSFLFRNDGGGAFTKLTSANISLVAANSIGCAWGDYDNDSFLDLVIGNAEGQNEHLYRNDRDGTFSRILTGPIPTSGVSSGSPEWVDYDNDGRLDLSVAPYSVAADSSMLLFHNEGAGEFSTVTDFPVLGAREGGVEWGDYDNDGDLDLLGKDLPTASESKVLIFRNDGSNFTRTVIASVTNTHLRVTSGRFGDYDNDGWLDLFVPQSIRSDQPQQTWTNLLFHNNGDGAFTRVTDGSIVSDSSYSGGAAWGDYDNDGFLDLFVGNGLVIAQQANFLYHNDSNSNHWLTIKCAGTGSNRSGIGAKVRAKAVIDGVELWQLRHINSGSGYNGSGLRANFGLGDATNASLVRIEWPSGTVQELTNVAADQILHVTEPPRIEWDSADMISWPASATIFQLQCAIQPDGPWTNATESVVVDGNRRKATLEANGPAKFYRLQMP